jgi:hypothetical protein
MLIINTYNATFIKIKACPRTLQTALVVSINTYIFDVIDKLLFISLIFGFTRTLDLFAGFDSLPL